MSKGKIIKFPGHLDSEDKESVPESKGKTRENPHEKKSSLGRIETFMITLIATVMGGLILAYIGRSFLSPMDIDISTSQDGLVGHINIDQHDEECKIYFIDSDYNLIVYLDNNSDIYMRVTDIYVNIIKCTDITEEDIIIGDYKHSGDARRPICLKTKIEHHTGKMETEIDRKLNPEYDFIPYSYILIPNNTGEKFSLSMDFEKQGYYNIEVEFNYMYDGKQRTIKTDPLNCVFLEREKNQ